MAKRRCPILWRKMWKFLKSSIANTLKSTSTSKRRKDIDIAKIDIGSMARVSSYNTLICL
jgi:hypothetical protein